MNSTNLSGVTALDDTMRFLDALGQAASPKTVLPASWITALLLRRRPGAAGVAIGTSLAVLAADVLKHYIPRRRPTIVDRTPLRSFPSGHSAASTAYLVGLSLIAPRSRRPHALAGACLGVLMVDALRIIAREHWLTDVLAGDALGVAAIATTRAGARAARDVRERHSPA